MELDRLAIKIARSENLPVLPQVATVVLRLADDPNASARNLEKMIERDPALAAKTLRVANSSYYGLSNISTVARAISILGMNTIRSLVVSVSFQQMVSGRAASQQLDKVAFWTHSLAVATAAKIITKMVKPEKAEELYVAGMMHDVGYLVLDRFCPAELDEAVRVARVEGIPLHQAERKVIGFDHGAVGGLLAEKWGLPEPLRYGICFHHDLENETLHQETTAIVALADYVANQSYLKNDAGVAAPELDPLVQSVLSINEQQLKVVTEVMMQEVTRATTAFALPMAA